MGRHHGLSLRRTAGKQEQKETYGHLLQRTLLRTQMRKI